MNNVPNAPLRGVLLDLAREKDSLESVFEFFDFVSKYNYNTVFLYLEDRIKTKTYPYRSDAESYSPEEIKRIVAYADKCGLELIPALSNFAHTERFLEHKELKHLSECRDGVISEFYGVSHDITACPLLPEAQEFFDAYYKEVSDLFPSKYFFIGLDEDFDIGTCELCRKDVEEHGGIGHLLLNHIKRTNDLVNSFGKISMLHNDMFIYCPEILPLLPKNIVLNAWCYDYIDPYPRAPMSNSRQEDLFEIYDRLGLQYIMTVWCNFTHNVDTYTKYASKHTPLAIRNTTWQMTAEQRLFTYPLLAYDAKLWDGHLVDEPRERLKEAIREVIGATDERDVNILTRAVEKPYLFRSPLYFLHDKVIRRNVNFEDDYKDVVLICDLLKTLTVRNDIVSSIVYRAERTKLYYEELILAEKILDYKSGRFDADMNDVISKLEAIKTQMRTQYDEQYALWDKYRHGVPTTLLDKETERVYSDVDKLIESARNAKFGASGVLHVDVFLPEKKIWRNVDVTVKYTDGTSEALSRGVYKPLATACYNIADKGPYFFTFSQIIEGGKDVDGIEISSFGSGNVCFRYVYAESGGYKYLPISVESVGDAENPEHLLIHDSTWCSMGDYDMNKAIINHGEAKKKTVVTLKMKKVK